MILRISASLSPRQSPRLAIRSSIRSDALIWFDDVTTALRGAAPFAAALLAGPRCADCARGVLAAGVARFADVLDVLPAIVFTPGLR
jgi:hypothetical protein